MAVTIKQILLSLVLLTALSEVVSEITEVGNDGLLIETNSGKIQGRLVKTKTQQDVRGFHGIPYAEPPVGGLRFKPPVPVTPWDGVLDVTKDPLPCYQQHTSESLKSSRRWGKLIPRPWTEDCLTLNVWAPVVVPFDAPVMIYIHTGMFHYGSGGYPYIDYSTFTFQGNVIMASINYRLGVFGFLSFGTSDAPGNLGLMDQRLAVKWVKENVVHFGGKSEAIFLIGLGAASATVGYQILNQDNKGLFRTGIMNSGAPTCAWAWDTKEDAVQLGKELSSKLGCQDSDETTELECMQSKHPEDILDAARVDVFYKSTQFKPNIDGSFIKEQPLESMKAGRFNNNTVIAFNNVKDASLTFFNTNEDLLTSGQDPGLSRSGFRESMRRVGLGQSKSELDAIEEWYLDCSKTPTEIRDAAVDAYSDGLFVCCTEHFIDYATEKGSLSYRGVFDIPDPRLPHWMGAELEVAEAIFTAATLDPKYNFPQDVQHTTLGVMNIAKIYSRKPAIEFQELMPLYNLKERPYLLWGKNLTFLSKYRHDDCVLWNDVIPQLRRGRKPCNT